VPPRDQVHVADLPTVREAARAYPYLRGGSRELFGERSLGVRARDCVSYDDGPTAASGRWVDYAMADGTSPYDRGRANPVVSVFKFHTTAGARRAILTEQRAIRRCEGRHTASDGYRVTSREIAVPRLGAARIAHRETVEGAGPGPSDKEHFATVWVRDGRYVVEVSAQSRTGPPWKHRVVRLTRVALHAIG
jgi:hypothetical protein